MGLLGVIIGILGLVLSLLLFWIQKIRKYPSQLSYSILDCSRIVGKKDSEFQDVSLHYKDYDIKEDLYYVKILIFNKRSSDVKANEKSFPIALTLKHNSRWLDIRVRNESSNVGSAVIIDPDTKQIASLSFPLLKKGEHIVVEGLVESNVSLVDKEESILSINHRIAELDTFDFVPVVTENRYKRCKRVVSIFGSIMLVTVLYLLVGLFLPEKSPVLFRNASDPGDLTEYSVAVDKKDRIVVDKYRIVSFGINTGTVVAKDEFESRFYPEYRFHNSMRFYYNIFMVLFAVLLYGYMLYDFIKDLHRYKMLQRYYNQKQAPCSLNGEVQP